MASSIVMDRPVKTLRLKLMCLLAACLPALAPAPVEEDTFGWQVLTTLASEVVAEATTGRFSLSLTVRAAPLDVSG